MNDLSISPSRPGVLQTNRALVQLVLLCLTALLLGLAGCGGGGGSDVGNSSDVAKAPVIDVQPLSQAAIGGSSVTFSVMARGSDLGYQWQRSQDAGNTWADVAGATAASYTLPGLTAAMNGWQFRVSITAAGASVLSSAVTVTVSAATAPVITVQPAGLHVLAGADASFSVTAGGTSLAYQWQRSSDGGAHWIDITGATAATLVMKAVATGDNGGQLRVVVSNSVGSVTSAAALLTVNETTAAPMIITQPKPASVIAPAAATFSVAASGSPAPVCQWQESTNNGSNWAPVSGATSCSYTTAATSTADSGKQFRVVLSNSAGNATSTAATLTVAAAAVAPTISTQPLGQTVTVPATATFSVVATGTPTPTYQWQLSIDGGLSFVNINGATGSSFTTAATTASDNGARYLVKVTNAAGSATSATAVLTVQSAAISPLAGRAWQTGQLLVATPTQRWEVIDDLGRVTIVYNKASGSRSALYAVRGTPNALTAAPTWSAPVEIDALNDAGDITSIFSTAYIPRPVAVSPAGNVAVLWTSSTPCTASSYVTSGSCLTLYVSLYRAATDAWEAPVQVPGWAPDAYGSGFNPAVKVDDQGNIVLSGAIAWETASSGAYPAYKNVQALFLRAAGETGFRQQSLTDPKLGRWDVSMDNQGNLLLAGNYDQNGTTDVVAFRGSVAGGVGTTPLVLDTRASAANFQLLTVGINGQQAVLWSQNNGVHDTWYSAIAASASDAFAVADIGVNLDVPSLNDRGRRLFVTDTGDLLVYDLNGTSRVRWTSSAGWGATQSIAELGLYYYRVGFNRRGDYLRVATDQIGYTTAYDGQRGVMLPAPGYVLGTATEDNNSNPYFYLYVYGYADPLLSVNGIGFNSILWNFDVLPTPALPAGDGRNAVQNLWGVFLK